MAKEISQTNTEYFTPVAIIAAGIIIAASIVYTGGIKIISETKDNGVPASDEQLLIPQEKTEFTITGEENILGDFNSPITIIEFSDLQCPYCRQFHLIVEQILEEYPGQVRWVYKHFPLDQIHPQARPAAEASECAAEQGKFWEFTDGLFKNQSILSESFYRELAIDTGLNSSQFNNCLSSRKYKDKVEADYQEGIKIGVGGTPTNFINGELVPGAVPYETLKAKVDGLLSQ